MVAAILVTFIYWVSINYLTVTVPVLVVMFVFFMILYAVIILRFGGIEEEIAIVLSFKSDLISILGH